MTVVPLNFDVLEQVYFYIDEPVEYRAKDRIIKIYPVKVRDSAFFLTSIGLLTIDKNSSPDVKIIQMSYLQFLSEKLLEIPYYKQQFLNILMLCLHWNYPVIYKDDYNKYYLKNEETGEIITSKQFEEIRRIILYQNIYGYDDEYINPDLKKAMQEQDELESKKLDLPTMERRIAIITSHCGLSKKEQLDMTYRSHTILFNEVCGEVNFMVKYPIALYAGKSDKIEHWIYKNKKNKFEKYLTSADKYARSMGSDSSKINTIVTNESGMGPGLENQFNNFNK